MADAWVIVHRHTCGLVLVDGPHPDIGDAVDAAHRHWRHRLELDGWTWSVHQLGPAAVIH